MAEAQQASATFPPPEEVRRRLEKHLQTWLGEWPPRRQFDVVESKARTVPGWDGQIHTVLGVASPGGSVLSVPPGVGARLREMGETQADAARDLGPLIGIPHGFFIEGTFRWCEEPVILPDAGEWLPISHPAVPAWLKPFGSPVLVSLDENNRYMAGVGIKRHDRWGHEIAVGTEPEYRGRGLARKLVAQAARQILEAGAVPTYLHADSNVASAHVAEASGFPQRGWRILGFWEREEG